MTLTITRSTLVTLVRNNYQDRQEAAPERRIIRAIENGLRHLSTRRVWEHLNNGTIALSGTPEYVGSDNSDTATVSHGGTSVTMAQTSPSDVVGAFIEFNGEAGWYEITAGASSTTLTLRDAYRNASAGNLSAVDFKILYPLIDLPADFRKRTRLIDTLRQKTLAPVFPTSLQVLHSLQAGGGQPRSYAVKPKRGDPNVQQLLLYPAPNAVEHYLFEYIRHAGWYSTATPATSTWKMRSTADTDYVDWPESKMDLLEAAIMAALYRETNDPGLAEFTGLYYQLLEDHEADDHENWDDHQLGDTLGDFDAPWVEIDSSLIP